MAVCRGTLRPMAPAAMALRQQAGKIGGAGRKISDHSV
ncbi:hypothetical protein ASAP_2671 [Asaia bogorensis]|uniref:Uncharacterized protein n=1 Tax=Asaia bogorensis TaxID=91915 RepID=A0A060QLG2_9PROT|nr:hypothetical protein ASAP_2671 [Asaia bogorensis]